MSPNTEQVHHQGQPQQEETMQGKTPQVPHRDQTQQQEIGPDSIQHKDNIMATHNNRIISINQNKCL